MTKEEIEAYYAGVIDGLQRYAWWKNGTQYVGAMSTTLESAIDIAKLSREAALEKLA